MRNPAVVAGVAAAVLLATSAAQAADVAATPPSPLVSSLAPPQGWPAAPAVTAGAYLLTNLDTGQVLAAKAPDQRRPVASAVKILTALTGLRRTSHPVAIRAITRAALADPTFAAIAARPSVRLAWHGGEVGHVELHGRRSPARGLDGGAAVGAWLADRAYAAMRGVTAAGRWPPGTSAT